MVWRSSMSPGLVEKDDAGCFFVDRQPVVLQRQLVGGTVGSYDDELVGGQALIADAEADGAGGHNGRVRTLKSRSTFTGVPRGVGSCRRAR